MEPGFVWLKFAVCAALILVAGTRLSQEGEIIAERTGLGRAWVGLVLLASVTSLPELVTGISAVTLIDAPDIAVGDLLGSMVFNLAILFVLEVLHPHESIFSRATQGHTLSAGFGVVLIGMVGFSLLLAQRGFAPSLGHAGVYSPLLVIGYLLAMRASFRYEKSMVQAGVAADRYHDAALRRAIFRYASAAVVVVIAGSWLPFVGAELADYYGWHRSFVGTLVVAAATSLPELVVSLAALRLGALDMAIANLLGSNLFNVAILAIDDVFYLRGPLLSHVSPSHAFSAFSAMMMTGAVIVGLAYRPQQRLFGTFGWIGLLLVAIYLINASVLFSHGS
jgi:cation:H+ antiporter